MTFNNVNLATITLTEDEFLALREMVEFLEKLESALRRRNIRSIIRADTQEMIDTEEILRARGILTGFKEYQTFWHQYLDREEE